MQKNPKKSQFSKKSIMCGLKKHIKVQISKKKKKQIEIITIVKIDKN